MPRLIPFIFSLARYELISNPIPVQFRHFQTQATRGVMPLCSPAPAYRVVLVRKPLSPEKPFVVN